MVTIRETRVTATRRHTTSHQSEAPSSKSTNFKCWRGCRDKGAPYTLVGMYVGTTTVETSMRGSLKRLGIELPCDPAIPFLGTYLEERDLRRYTPQCSLQHCSQQPRHGSHLRVRRQRSGERCGVWTCSGIALSPKKE